MVNVEVRGVDEREFKDQELTTIHAEVDFVDQELIEAGSLDLHSIESVVVSDKQGGRYAIGSVGSHGNENNYLQLTAQDQTGSNLHTGTTRATLKASGY